MLDMILSEMVSQGVQLTQIASSMGFCIPLMHTSYAATVDTPVGYIKSDESGNTGILNTVTNTANCAVQSPHATQCNRQCNKST
jgi:hypothetical protein